MARKLMEREPFPYVPPDAHSFVDQRQPDGPHSHPQQHGTLRNQKDERSGRRWYSISITAGLD